MTHQQQNKDQSLSFQWPHWSRSLFKGTRGHPRYRGAKGGRASGKSHLFAEKVVFRLLADADTKVICIREVQKSLEFSARQLLVDKIAELGVDQYFEIQVNRINCKFGSGVVIFQGMQDHTADSVKSLEGFDIAWCEEAQSLSSRSLELLDPTLRKLGSEMWFTWNPYKPDDPVEEIFKDNENSVLVHVNYKENPHCPPAVKEMAERIRGQNIKKYNHVWLGDYLTEVEGALWSGDLIQATRVKKEELPDLSRIVVAIDPAVTGGKNSDETGIIVAGKCSHHQQYYILEDASLRGSPEQWIRRAISKYHEYQADRIIAEVNNGGDLVEKLIRDSDRSVSYRAVRATRGKMLRAEPIAALYERNKVFHAGKFPELEEQMIFYNGHGNVSPDRLDALVWAVTELSLSTGNAVWRIT